jgi:acyl-CoA hydrolase
MGTVEERALADALASLPAEPRIVVGGNGAVPGRLLELLDGAVQRYRLFMLNARRGIPDRPGVTHETCFVGPGMRGSASLSYVPARLSLVPKLFRTALPPDVVAVTVAPPVDGMFSLGAEVNVLPAAIEACKKRGGLVLAQVNRHMPWTFGDGLLAVGDVDHVLVHDEPLGQPKAAVLDDASRQVGERLATLVTAGATLQMGIGTVPDAALPGLAKLQDLAIWSEMISDGVLGLERAGVLDDAVPLTASFLYGSADLYTWAHRNERIQVLRTETTNSPGRIAACRGMTSINTALQVDLFGQVNATRIAGRIHSGFGGQPDFVVGALHAVGGQALMALRSWHPKADVSAIVPLVDEPVSSFQPTAVITEQGVARVFGQDEKQQAHQLVEHAAHPRVRDELREEARSLGVW